MQCDKAREAISAALDGEDGGVPDDALATHLAGCAECRDWQQRAYAVTRRARLGGAFLDHDLTERVLAAAPQARAGRRGPLARRTALAALALAQVAITVPLLVFGHDHDAGAHAAHELGCFDLALAVAFCVGAIRPALSAGLAWPCCIAATGLVGTAVLDLIGGATIGVDEAQHLIALTGAMLLLWQARTIAAGAAGPQSAAALNDAGVHAAAPRLAAAEDPQTLPRSMGDGTDAARVDGPATAARADGPAKRLIA